MVSDRAQIDGYANGPLYVINGAKEIAGQIRSKLLQNEIEPGARVTNRFDVNKPSWMVLLGTGCGEVAKSIIPIKTFAYKDLEGMPHSTAPGHAGELILGTYNDVQVVAFKGRLHQYEGHSAQSCGIPIYLAKELGARACMMTTAGGVARMGSHGEKFLTNYPMSIGTLGVVESVYPNFLSSSQRGIIPLNSTRFPAMFDAPSIVLRNAALGIGWNKGIDVKKVLYVPRSGPEYETTLEVSFLAEISEEYNLPVIGGMSVVPELQAACAVGMPTLVLAVVTNQCFDLEHLLKVESNVREKIHDAIMKGPVPFQVLQKYCSSAIKQNEPAHEEICVAGSESNVTKSLERLMGSMVNRILL